LEAYYPETDGFLQILRPEDLEKLRDDKQFKTQSILFFTMRHLMNLMKSNGDVMPDRTILFDDLFFEKLVIDDITESRAELFMYIAKHCTDFQTFSQKQMVVMPVFNVNHFTVLAFSPFLYYANVKSPLLHLDSYVSKDKYFIDTEIQKRLNTFLDLLLSLSTRLNDFDGKMNKTNLTQFLNDCKFDENGNVSNTGKAHTFSVISVSQYIPIDERQSIPNNGGGFIYRDYNCALYAGVYAYTLAVTSNELYAVISSLTVNK
jgi:hypothetical protein